MARTHRILIAAVASILLVAGALAHADDSSRVAHEPLVSSASSHAWVAAHATVVQPARGAQVPEAYVTGELPDGWRQVAAGTWTNATRPGDGSLVYVVRAPAPMPTDAQLLDRMASAREARWSSLDVARVVAETTPVLGSVMGIVTTYDLVEALPNASGLGEVSRIETRSRRDVAGSIVVLGLDDASDPSSALEVRRVLDRIVVPS